MSRLVVIADPDRALGFQLAGVDVVRAEDVEAARTHLLQLIDDRDVGLIAISSIFLDKLDDATRRRIDADYRPVVIGLPQGSRITGGLSRRERIAALIRRAIGFHITFAGETGEE